MTENTYLPITVQSPSDVLPLTDPDPIREKKTKHDDKGKSNRQHVVIGILTTSRITPGKPKEKGVKAELAYLSRIGRRMLADVYVFNPWDIDWKNHTFVGYELMKDANGEFQWKKKKMPPPHVVYDQIYNRAAESRYRADKSRLIKLTGGLYFNPHYLNKYSIHNNLKSVKSISPHLPETRILKKTDDIKTMLKNHHQLYIKPVNGSLGHGIMRLSRDSGRFKLETGKGRKSFALSFSELYRKIINLTGKRNYIVQQGIKLISYRNRVVDIRVLVQKNGKGDWSITKTYARVAPPGKITSNLSTGGTAHPLKVVLSESFGPDEVMEIRTRIRHLAIEVCKAVEETTGTIFGEMGVDLGVDQGGRIWIIEVNSKPRRTTLGNGSARLINLSFSKPIRFAYYLVTKKRHPRAIED